jgi:hypothetical protein
MSAIDMFEEDESTDIGKSQRFRKEGNSRIIKVWHMNPGFAKIIDKVHYSGIFENTEADHCIAANDSGAKYADTWSSNRVH